MEKSLQKVGSLFYKLDRMKFGHPWKKSAIRSTEKVVMAPNLENNLLDALPAIVAKWNFNWRLCGVSHLRQM